MLNSEAPLAVLLILESRGVCAAVTPLLVLLLRLLLLLALEPDDTDNEWEEEL